MKKYKLKEVADIITGITPSSDFSENWGSGCKFVTPTDIHEYDYTVKAQRLLSSASVRRQASRIIKGKGVAVVCIGATIGKLARIEEPVLTNQQINTIVPNPDLVDNEYLFYKMQLLTGYLRQLAGGSATPILVKSTFENIALDFPELNMQKTIGGFFSLIDAKILNNNVIIGKIEQLIRILHNYWFLQFDFPDASGKPYKSSGGAMMWSEELKKDIPNSWEVKYFSDIQPILTGKEDANFATKDGKFNFYTCSEGILKCDDYAFDGKAVLLAGNGNFGIKLYEGKFNAYQRTYVLIPNDPKYYTVVYLTLQDRVKSLANGSRGSIVKFITKGDIESICMALPKSAFGEEFSQLNDLTLKIEKAYEENQKLEEIKNYLLPLMMNGQVGVSG